MRFRFPLAVTIVVLAGCSADRAVNPSFPLSVNDAEAALTEMEDRPVPLTRPLVVAGGFIDPGLVAPALAGRLEAATADDAPIITVSFFGASTFDACRDRLIAAVEEAWPSDSPDRTIEVDVVGFSMGGLVARYAARPREDGTQLVIRRLFTISTPHRGATMAAWPTLDDRAGDMRSGSAFLLRLDQAAVTYELLAYTRLDDAIVGEANAAPPGRWAWWVPSRSLEGSHIDAWRDPRILADISRRLRGEPAFATDPPAPLPGGPDVANEVSPRRHSEG
jgi:hypothetical protein